MAGGISREITVRSDTASLAQVRAAVIEVAGLGMFSPVKAGLLALAVDEAVTNVIEHAYRRKLGPEVCRKITIGLTANASRFEARIGYRGVLFDPRTAPEINLRKHLCDGRRGGLGIFLMRHIMDEINYFHKSGMHNELRMIKYIDARAALTKSKVRRKGG